MICKDDRSQNSILQERYFFWFSTFLRSGSKIKAMCCNQLYRAPKSFRGKSPPEFDMTRKNQQLRSKCLGWRQKPRGQAVPLPD